MIRAIETKYRGFRFRSRLEARWAVALDALGVRWDYEREGFEFDRSGGRRPLRYLPDFWIERAPTGLWAEVKGQPLTSDERELATLLVAHTGAACLLLVGPPDFAPFEVLLPRRGRPPASAPLAFLRRGDERSEQAVGAARAARFEHGETPR